MSNPLEGKGGKFGHSAGAARNSLGANESRLFDY